MRGMLSGAPPRLGMLYDISAYAWNASMKRLHRADGERGRRHLVFIVLITIATIGGLIFISYVDRDWPYWTGFGRFIDVIEDGKGNVAVESQPRKTLWDFLELLIVPVILAVGGYWLNQSGNQREKYRQEQQR